jgi:valyl-tRNA synthetase
VTAAWQSYQFADACRALYGFAWDEFCSFYVEMVKGRLQEPATRPVAQRVLAHTLDTLLRLLHPVMPFITEEIWQLLNGACPQRGIDQPAAAKESVMIAPWPAVEARRQDAQIEAQFARFQEVLTTLRDIRARQNITSKTTVRFALRCATEVARLQQPMTPYYRAMANAEATAVGPNVAAPAQAAQVSIGDTDVIVDLEGLIDVVAELARLEKELDNLQKQIKSKEGKLSNASFVERAPADVVAKERASLDDLRRQLTAAGQALAKLCATKKS